LAEKEEPEFSDLKKNGENQSQKKANDRVCRKGTDALPPTCGAV